jgi:hypothetical protein
VRFHFTWGRWDDGYEADTTFHGSKLSYAVHELTLVRNFNFDYQPTQNEFFIQNQLADGKSRCSKRFLRPFYS